MASQIFSATPLSDTQVTNLANENQQRELKWLISDVIRPQLPEIKEGLASCLRQISEDNDAVFKLPLSSHKSELLKGTISRQNYKVIGLNVQIKSKVFTGSISLKESAYVIIRQLLDCHDSIYNAVSTIEKLLEVKEGQDAVVFLKYINQLYNHILSATNSLDKPNAAYIFPKYRNPADKFEPEMPECINLDFLVNNSELTVDFHGLKPVTRRPWCTIIDPQNGISFADHVRSKISTQRRLSVHQIIIDEYKKLQHWRKVEDKSEDAGDSLSTAFKSIFVSTGDPSLSSLLKSANKHLAMCITYINNDNKPTVVNVLEKCEMVTSDPILLSLSIKLDSLEKAVKRMRENLRNCS